MGDVYEGTFENGSKSGYGVLKYASGAIYQGQWSLDKANGKGQMRYANGDTYDGYVTSNSR